MFLTDHERSIVDQFTRQAAPFADAAHHNDEDALKQILRVAAPRKTDRVLDVACGPGIVARVIAPHVATITGVDITPAMLAEAGKRAEAAGITNVAWREGDATRLPFADASFDLVVTRYSFHHFVCPARVLGEMVRVCRPGGRIVVIDIVQAPEKVVAFDMMETLRDPSHTSTLTRAALATLFREAGLAEEEYATHGVTVELEDQLGRSFPNPGDADRIRDLFVDEPEWDRLGVRARRDGASIRFTYPIGVARGRKS